MKLLIMQLYPASCKFLPLGSKCIIHLSTCIMCSLCEHWNSTSGQNNRLNCTFSSLAVGKSKDFEPNADKHSQVLIGSVISS
jgi:hypothetical protein